MTDAVKIAEAAGWEALLQRCAADPEKALRVVMVGRSDFELALAKALSALDAAGYAVVKKPEIVAWHGWATQDDRLSVAEMTNGTLVLWLIAKSRPIQLDELHAMIAASSQH